SHALAMNKLAGVALDAAIFTNLSRDHLDFHHTFEDYFNAKKKLFTDIRQKRGYAGFVNADDPYGIRLQTEVGGLHGFGVKNGETRAWSVSLLAIGSTFEVRSPHSSPFPVHTSLLGEHNLYNVLGVVAVALHLGIAPEAIQQGIEAVRLIPGRMEPVDAGQDFTVIVDYAHTPDSLLKILASTRRFAKGQVLCVFGCGGDRDTGKRAKMGRIAAELADRVFITSDNPRSEQPESILCHILAGVPLHCAAKIQLTADRRAAIQAAVQAARPGDAVVIAGKGHETYQILKDKTIPFDDREEARKALAVGGAG
ncbi:MAG: Mur ligase family protein, partial [bacterium]